MDPLLEPLERSQLCDTSILAHETSGPQAVRE